MLLRWHEKEDFIYFFVPLLFGTFAEIIASYSGAWIYSKPLFIVPIWLPFLWGIAALGLVKLLKIIAGKN